MPDTILQEIRKTRDEYARQFNYDLHQMCLDLRREQELSGKKVVNFATKAIRPKLAESIDQVETNKPGATSSQV